VLFLVVVICNFGWKVAGAVLHTRAPPFPPPNTHL
jgi:hypothetical protein